MVDKLRSDGCHVACLTADLTDATQTTALIGRATASFGPIDVLVNNASVFEHDTITSFDVEAFDRMSAINLRAPLLLAQAFVAQTFAAQAREAGDPSIVNLLDQRILALNPLYLSYTLSKAGLAAATTMLAQALAPRIRVNAVAPGPVLPNVNEGDTRFNAEVAEVLLARAVPPDAIADAVSYLVGARAVTGQTIAVDSGQRLSWRTPDVLASMKDDKA